MGLLNNGDVDEQDPLLFAEKFSIVTRTKNSSQNMTFTAICRSKSSGFYNIEAK